MISLKYIVISRFIWINFFITHQWSIFSWFNSSFIDFFINLLISLKSIAISYSFIFWSICVSSIIISYFQFHFYGYRLIYWLISLKSSQFSPFFSSFSWLIDWSSWNRLLRVISRFILMIISVFFWFFFWI